MHFISSIAWQPTKKNTLSNLIIKKQWTWKLVQPQHTRVYDQGTEKAHKLQYAKNKLHPKCLSKKQ